jgi:hypothetical protein
MEKYKLVVGFHPAHKVNSSCESIFGFHPAHKRVVDKKKKAWKKVWVEFLIFFKAIIHSLQKGSH